MTLYSLGIVLVMAGWLSGSLNDMAAVSLLAALGWALMGSRGLAAGVQ